jgi:antitoxin YefM
LEGDRLTETATIKEFKAQHTLMNALKYKTIIKNGQLDLPPLDLPEGTVVEAILLIQEPTEMDETDYLLSTEANRQHLKEALESLKNPDNYIYVDPAKL